MILSQHPPSWHLLMVSARTDASLAAAADNLVRFLGDNPRLGLADVSFTLLAGRELLDLRKALVCRDAADAADILRGQHPHRLITGTSQARNRKTVLVLSGRSAPALDLAPTLYASLPVFRREIDYCLGLVGGGVADALARRLLPDGKAASPAGQASPDAAAAFVFSYALARQWLGWGLSPDALIAEGVGECVAAHLAGCLTLEAALRLARGEAGAGDDIAPAPPRLPYHSGVTGAWITDRDIADGGYWSRLARGGDAATPYRGAEDDRVALDIGTGQVCDASRLGTREDVEPDGTADGQQWMLSSLGRLAVSGAKIDWTAHFTDRPVRRLSLPTYPFEPRRHWFAIDKPTPADVPIATPPPPTPAKAAPAGGIERFLVEACQELLGIEPIGLHDNVMKLGMDSLSVMQLSVKVNRQFGVSIAPHHLFSQPDIASLAGKIAAMRPDLGAPAAAPGGTSAAQLVRFVESLSDADVKRMLAELGVSNA